jgi:PEP-CTERM motif
MNRTIRVTSSSLLGCVACGLSLLLTGQAQAAVQFGVNFQSDVFDPDHVVHDVDASIVGLGPAFGVPEADWIEPGVFDGLLDPTPFSTPIMNGASVDLSAYNYLAGREYTNAGMIHYGDPVLDPGHTGTAGPQTGEEAVLASFLFAISDAEAPGLGTDAHVTLSGLAAVASATGVPLNYKVTVFSTSEWIADIFSPALITDNAANSQMIGITPIPGSERRWSSGDVILRYHGNGGRGDSDPIFTGDTLDISVVGANEVWDGADPEKYGRSNIAGVIVEFVPAGDLPVPEPSTIVLLALGGVALAGCRRRLRRTLPLVVGVGLLSLLASEARAVSIGTNWGADTYAFGPYSVLTGGPFGTPGYASAFGVAAGDWLEPGPDPNSVGTPFSPAAGGSVTVAWQSSFPDGNGSEATQTAYGWAHANMGAPYASYNNGDGYAGTPQNGDETVLSGFLYGLSTAGGDPVDRPITVTISGLGSVASANGMPLQYRVHLMASSHYEAQRFTPGMVADSNAISEQLDFDVMSFHPRWNYTLRSSGATADSSKIFTGDSVTITLTGPNEYNMLDIPPGDANADGVVNIFDINLVSSNWNTGGPTGDVNGDQIVNIFDINLISSHWGETGTGELQYGRTTLSGVSIEFVSADNATAVPEPGSLVLATLAALGTVLSWRLLRKR